MMNKEKVKLRLSQAGKMIVLFLITSVIAGSTWYFFVAEDALTGETLTGAAVLSESTTDDAESIEEPVVTIVEKVVVIEEKSDPVPVETVVEAPAAPQAPIEVTEEEDAPKETLEELDARMRELGASVYADLERYKKEREDGAATEPSDPATEECEGVDLTLIKHSTCLDPFEEGGYGFGGGSGGGSSGPPQQGNQNAGPG